MKNKLKILFMGTPDFALGVLKKLQELEHDICGVVTAPDKEAGRGKKKKESVVKKWATSKNLPVYQPTNLKSESFYNQLTELNPDVILVVAFRMLPKKVWNFPPKGTINLHASLLPDYRGAAPIHWAIINGETQTGVTTFFINEEIDTGKIILSKKIDIEEKDNVASLHDKLMNVGSHLVVETLEKIKNNTYQTTDQKLSDTDKKAPKLDRATTKINWENQQQDLYNFIRGLSPFPCSWCYINKKPLSCKIYKVSKTTIPSTDQPGTIFIDGKHVYVNTRDFNLEIEEIQLPNRKKMTAQEAVNGNLIASGAIFV